MANERELENIEGLSPLTRPERWMYIVAYFRARWWRPIIPWVGAISAGAVLAGFVFICSAGVMSKFRGRRAGNGDLVQVDPYWLIPVGIFALYVGYRAARAEHPIIRAMLVRAFTSRRPPRCVKCDYAISGLQPVEGRLNVVRCSECGLLNPLPPRAIA